MKKKYLFFLALVFFLNGALVNADFSPSKDIKNDCLELIKKEDSSNDYSNLSKYQLKKSSNDGLISINFKPGTFENYIYTFGSKSQLQKEELYKIDGLYGEEKDSSNFYDNELNFSYINNNRKREFLYCSISKNININGKLENLKNGDAVSIYTSTPDKYLISEINYNNRNWKKITISKTYKDKYGKNNNLKIDSIYFVPYNKNLLSFYNLYDLAVKYGDIIKSFNDDIKFISDSDSNIKEISNKDGIQIKTLFEGEKPSVDKFGLRHTLVNGINYFGDFTEYLRHRIFEYLMKKNSSLAYDIFIPVSKGYSKTNINTLDPKTWTNYYLGSIDLTKDMIEKSPYYLNKDRLLNNSYYHVSDRMDKKVFVQHMGGDLYKEKSLDVNKLKTLLSNNYSTLIGQYEEFKNEYEKLDGSSVDGKKNFIKKYGKIFGYDKIFTTASKLSDSNKNTKIEKTEKSDTGNTKRNIVIIGFIFVLFLGFLLRLRKKKGN